jgi:copper(I)-binding protein
MKTHNLLALAAMLGGLALPGCSKEEPPAPADAEGKAGEVVLAGAVLTLPAVKGNPGAAYFTVVNRTARPLSLTGVEVAGAERTEMHNGAGSDMAEVERIAVPSAGYVAFVPTGYHAMVFGVPAGLKVGREAQITLKFEDGRKLSAPAEIRGPGMADMDHGAGH